MKVIIPVAGTGTRLWPHTYTQPKALMPVAGKPIISFMLDELLRAGCIEFIFITGYLGDKIRHYVEEQYPQIKAHYIEQKDREGLGHAIWLAKDFFFPDEPLLILLGDSVFDIDMKEVLNSKDSVLGVKKVEDPRGFGVAVADENDYITRVVEKPNIPVSNQALIGLYKINNSIRLFDALAYIVQHDVRTNQSIQLTDALMHMIDKGEHFKAYRVNNWFDCGQKDSLLDTNTILLRKRNDLPESFQSVTNTIIIPPVAIDPTCIINNAIIGPYVTVGEHTQINDCIIRDSIIGSYSVISNAMLHRSVIGNDATIIGRSKSLNLGDDTEIDLRN
jgi:glucose-1-phosphate thymidylyltransferase